jgi:hypothetical protein
MLRYLVDGGRSAVLLGGRVVRLAAFKKLKERAFSAGYGMHGPF